MLLGVMPPAYLPTPWRYLFYFHPVRVLRILFGASVDTSEEQLSLFLRTHGPVVAIGKPGERFASPGASRMYVTNDEWQNVVLEHLESSQIVLLQPAQTEGIWWEVEKTIRRVAPQKVLFCMVNFLHRQNDYEKFRLRAAQFIKHPLPRNLAYTQTASFLYFDGDWRPFVQEVSCRSPLIWPVVGNAVDLKYTLEPFFNSAHALQEHRLNAKTGTEIETTNFAEVTDSEKIADLLTRESKVTSMLPSMLPRQPRGLSLGAQSAATLIFFALSLSIPLLARGVPAARKAAQQANIEDANATNIVVTNPQAEKPNSLGIAYYKQGKFDLASTALTKSIELNDQDPETFLFRGDALESLQRREEAIHDYERALALDPTYVQAWNNLGFNYQQMGNYAQAIQCYSKAIELSDTDASFFANRGIALLFSGQPDPAIADLTHSLEMDAQQPQVYRYKGQALAQKGEWVEAIQHFNTALQADPDIVDAYFHRGKAFMALGDQKSDDFNPYELARQDFEGYFSRAPTDTRILLDHAQTHRLDGNFDDAIADITKFLELVPGDDVAMEQRLNVFYEAERFDEAIADAKSLIEMHPDDPGKMEQLASLLFLVSRYDEAVTQTDATIEKFPDSLDSYRIRGNCLYQQDRYDEALESFGHVLKSDPHDTAALTTCAQIFAIRNQYEQSAGEYEKLAEAQPDKFDPRYFLMYALAAGHQRDKLESTRSSLSTTFGDTENPEIRMLLARLSLLGPNEAINWASGMSEIKGLHEANPGHDDIGLLFGAYQFHTVQFAEAEATLRAVVQKAAEPRIIASAQLWLSQALSRLGKLEEAKESFEMAEAWIKVNANLDLEREQAVRDETVTDTRPSMEWWQRVELQNWMASARNTLADAEPKKESAVKPEEKIKAVQTRNEDVKE